MDTFKSFEENLYPINERDAHDIALKLYHFQSENNPVYASFITHTTLPKPATITDIPFLPIALFKNHLIKTGSWEPETVFTSSGTTGAVTSTHLVKETAFYTRHAQELFERSFGALDQYHVLALLPSYLERDGSSLVVMADHFIRESHSPYSGFYLNNLNELAKMLAQLKASPRKVLLLGVTFALLDLAEKFPMDLSHCLIMETGGMKGRRKEIIREELHRILCERLSVPFILSEYGMTELFSQAYSFGAGKFKLPASMMLLIRDVNDPRHYVKTGRTGAINIIDLANVHTCAFIETADLGRIDTDGTFEVLGRMDNSDIRGCNLLVE